MSTERSFFSLSLARALCLAAALWFVLSPTAKVLLAHAFGKQIEIVVCTGSGLKKVYVSVDSGDDSSKSGHESSIKHCSNTPLALAATSFAEPLHLAYSEPQTLSTWQVVHAPTLARDWVLNGRPPPGRAPPALG